MASIVQVTWEAKFPDSAEICQLIWNMTLSNKKNELNMEQMAVIRAPDYVYSVAVYLLVLNKFNFILYTDFYLRWGYVRGGGKADRGFF